MKVMPAAKPKISHYQSALSITALILIILMALTALLVQQALRHSQRLQLQSSTSS